MKTKNVILSLIGAVSIAGGVQAAPAGYVDLTLGKSYAENDNDDDSNNAGFGAISGAVATAIGSAGTIVVEAELRKDKHSGDIISNEDMDGQKQVGIHYLHEVNGNKFGGFLAYGVATHEFDNDPGDEDYKTLFGGIEGIYSISPETTLFGQLGLGSNRNDDDVDSAGFEGGQFLRIGAAYNGLKDTTLRLEAEAARSDEYEDSDEAGLFRKLALMGETNVGSNSNLAVTYGLSYGKYDAKGDDDELIEKSLHVGIRYYFGGASTASSVKSGFIGLPTLPVRAGAWVPELD